MKQKISAFITITAVYVVLHILNIGCPIRFITGISCAGCGMTRAWLSVLELNFLQAFHFHPLFWTVPVISFVYLVRKRISNRTLRFVKGITIILFTTVYIMRMLNPEDTVVEINIYKSVVWHILERVRKIL